MEFIYASTLGLKINLDLLNLKSVVEISQDKAIKIILVDANEVSKLCPDLPYITPPHATIKLMAIGDFPYQPCGGTHVKSTQDLRGLEVLKFKIKKDTLRVSYQA